MSLSRVFSGVQPTGRLHLGNYLGAIRQWLRLQEEHHDSIDTDRSRLLFCVADLHALTATNDPSTSLQDTTRDVAAHFLACGIDPARCVLFPQSAVSEHAELAWILACCAPLSALQRMTQFKAKATTATATTASLGLLSYPVLMAADVLLYRSSVVPVGEDQTQHMELARDLARAFARRYPAIDTGKGTVLPVPRTLVSQFPRVMSLRDATCKMSKSDPSPMSRLHLTDTNDTIVNKIRKAKTDCISSISFDVEERPDVSNLVRIFAELSDKSTVDVCSMFEGKSISEFKSGLADLCVHHIAPIRERILELRRDPSFVDSVLADGADSAREIAQNTMALVRETIGIYPAAVTVERSSAKKTEMREERRLRKVQADSVVSEQDA